MNKEIERRFLVFSDRIPKLSRGQKIIQGYLSLDPPIRTRIKEQKASINVKFSDNFLTRTEFEYKIPLKDAEFLLTKTQYKIVKTRYLLKLNGKIWEIDFFEGQNSGLVIAEVELPAVDARLQKPLWLNKEITCDPRFLNVNLAVKPYTKW